MSTKHFLLNLQCGSTLSKLRNFGGGGFEPPFGTPLMVASSGKRRIARSALFWDITQRKNGSTVPTFRNLRSHLQRSESPRRLRKENEIRSLISFFEVFQISGRYVE
jgi:hypothetical protein